MDYIVHHWSFDPLLPIVAVVVVAHEIGLARLRHRSIPERTRSRRHRSVAFYAGLAVLVVAVDSPIDHWAYDYFFIHIIEHLLVAFYAPMLVVFGAPWIPLLFALPVGTRRRSVRFAMLGPWSRVLRPVGRVVGGPWFAFLSFNLMMVVWHLPGALDLAQENEVVHVWLMQGSFFLTGILFWLQIITSPPFRPKAGPLWQAGAVIGTNVIMFVLAMSMSIFTASNWYSVYAHVPGVSLAPFADQQIGAAILWICGDFWAGPALLAVIRRAVEQEGSLSNVLERLAHRDGRVDGALLPSPVTAPAPKADRRR